MELEHQPETEKTTGGMSERGHMVWAATAMVWALAAVAITMLLGTFGAF